MVREAVMTLGRTPARGSIRSGVRVPSAQPLEVPQDLCCPSELSVG
jgi:hypothetical protein